MASSKSSRTSFLPSSVSLTALRSSAPLPTPPATSSSTNSSSSSSAADPQYKIGFSGKNKSTASPERNVLRKTKPPIKPLERQWTTSEQSDQRRDTSPHPLNRRSKTWSSRVSAFFPSLTSSDIDPHSRTTGSISRKPIPNSTMAVPSPATPPPPPPYEAHDGRGPKTLQKMPPAVPPKHDVAPVPRDSAASPPFVDLNFADSPADMTPHINNPIPPSPEVKRATLTKPEPPARTGGQGGPSPPASVQGEPHATEAQGQHRRQGSLQQPKSGSLSNLLAGAAAIVGSEQRGRRAASVQVPPASTGSSPNRDSLGTRVASLPVNPAPPSPPERGQSPSKGLLRRSWLPGGGRSRSNSVDVSSRKSAEAWILPDDNHADYNAQFLKNGDKVPELWNESGNVLVYLYPRGSGCGPSFKVQEFTVSSSYIFNELIMSDRENSAPGSRGRASFSGRDSLSVNDATRIRSPPTSPPVPESSGELKLYLPIAPPSEGGQLSVPGQGSDAELDRLVAIRNLFAFLTGQPLVATRNRDTIFKAFVQIAALLEEFGFASPDGATFGNAVEMSFDFYVDQLRLADCRNSREKTVEALILGERMRSIDLYTEAFAHAAGKYSAIMDLGLPLFQQVSAQTRLGLERAHIDLVNKQHAVNNYLDQFEFPSLFAGIANSTSSPELRQVRFKVWRSSFMRMRHFVLGYYKSTFGNWPPKASSSKNPFAESGLNRLVLKMLYSDMCALYDLLVDRKNLTSRVIDEVPAISSEGGKMTLSALRNIMSEFDRSRPPVLPPVPYDTPQLPSMASVLETYQNMSFKDQVKFDKQVKQHELILVLNKAYNYDTNSIKLPFLDQFKEFELREAKGKMAPDLVDQRIGYWLFLYAVLQSLPMLVVDAPGLKYTEGTEYFLCQPPMGNPPWVEDRQVKKMWYEVAGGGGLVELSQDAVLFSTEATYHRSHCWLAAKQWEGASAAGMDPLASEEPVLSPLQPPPGVLASNDFISSPPTIGSGTPTPPPGSPQLALRPRTLSPGDNRASRAYRSSIALGLEPVPMDLPVPFSSHQRSSSQGPRYDIGGGLGSRTRSHGNLSSLASQYDSPRSGSPAQQSAVGNPDATFDDILGGNSGGGSGGGGGGEQPDKKGATKKKKGRFF